MAYDATADTYAQLVGTELSAAIEGALDRALLRAFVELVADATPKLVADVGCGPGRVAAFLAGHGLEVVGVDVSTAMLAVARDAHPGIHFAEGRLTELPVPDAALAGAVCWYSIIHTPPEHLDAVGTELMRALAPEGHVLLAFQAGDGERVHRTEVYGRAVSLTSYRHVPDHVTECLTTAGFEVHARAVREPELAHESTPQAFLLARRPAGQVSRGQLVGKA
ncbi:MAG: Methyltransferase type 11 [Acidimicrobiales bacterium]|nr:Methyltransferase type 11 [Acidimicrobiales bacterium]